MLLLSSFTNVDTTFLHPDSIAQDKIYILHHEYSQYKYRGSLKTGSRTIQLIDNTVLATDAVLVEKCDIHIMGINLRSQLFMPCSEV